MVTKATRSIILAAALVAAASTCFAGSAWEKIGDSMAVDKAGTKAGRQMVRNLGVSNQVILTKNAGLVKAYVSNFRTNENSFRNMCAPTWTTPRMNIEGPIMAAAVKAYVEGTLSYQDVVYASEHAKAMVEVNAQMDTEGLHATFKPMLLENSNRLTMAQTESATRAQFIAGQYPGSSVSCVNGNGLIAYDLSNNTSFRDNHTWKTETIDGRYKETIVAVNGGFNVSLEYGSFSANVILVKPGQEGEAATSTSVVEARSKYEAKLADARMSHGVNANETLGEAYKRGDLKETLKANAAAEYEAMPEMMAAGLAQANAQYAAEEARDKRKEKAEEDIRTRRMGGNAGSSTLNIQDAPFQIISVSLDSSRDTSLSERDAAVKTNALVKHIEDVYRTNRGGVANKMSVVAFLRLVLSDPEMRQAVAK